MPTKKSRAEYMRAYRKAKPQKKLAPELRALRDSWALGLADLAERAERPFTPGTTATS